MRVTSPREKEGKEKEKDRDKYVHCTERGRGEIEKYIYYLKSGILYIVCIYI